MVRVGQRTYCQHEAENIWSAWGTRHAYDQCSTHTWNTCDNYMEMIVKIYKPHYSQLYKLILM